MMCVHGNHVCIMWYDETKGKWVYTPEKDLTYSQIQELLRRG